MAGWVDGNEEIRKILEEANTIAVVGLSRREHKPSHYVSKYMQGQGYRIIPVNPSIGDVLGEKAYPDLLSVPLAVDLVVIFRRSEDVPPVVEQAIRKGVKAIWMQVGIINEEAAHEAGKAGIPVVMDRCALVEHKHLIRG